MSLPSDPGHATPGLGGVGRSAPPTLADSEGRRAPDAVTGPLGVESAAADPAGVGGVRGPRRASRSPQRRDRKLATWLTLLACLALALAPSLIDVHRPDVVDEREARTIVGSMETWRQQAQHTYDDQQWSIESLVPWYNGQPQYQAMPGTTWLHVLALSSMDPDRTRIDQVVLRTRLVSVAMGLLAVASLFWAGVSIGGLGTAALAALVLLACPVFLLEARLATPAMPHLGLSLLSIAAALWAIRPLKPAAPLLRQALGWAGCGLALGLATLTGSLVNTAAITLALLLILILCPHRISHLLGLVAAVFIAALVTAPWILYVHGQHPDAWRSWVAALEPAYQQAPGQLAQLMGKRALLVLVVMLPWSPWLIAAMIQPLSTSSAGSRVRMFLAWVWFVSAVLLLLPLPGSDSIESILLAVPAGALLVAQVLHQLADLSAEGRHARMWRLLRWPQAAMLLAASLALPVVMHLQAELVQRSWLPGLLSQAMPQWYWIGAGGCLLLLALLSVRFVVRHYPGRAAVAWSLWVVVGFVLLIVPLARGPLMQSPLVADGAFLRLIANDRPVYYLPAQAGEAASAESEPLAPSPELLLYAGSPLRTVSLDQIAQAQEEHAQLYILAPRRLLPQAGLQAVRQFQSLDLTLWQTAAAPSAAGVTMPLEQGDADASLVPPMP